MNELVRISGAESAASAGTSSEGLRQVAFAGHNRAHDLGPRDEACRSLEAAFALLREAGIMEARLLTGLAPGADQLAARAWQAVGLGPIHAVLPFLDARGAEEVSRLGPADGATWLDGAAAEAEGRNAHLKQTRFIVEAADLVVVVWTGGQARGAGGTADAVFCALELGLPVLWIKPGDATLRLIRPERLPSDFHFPEFQEALHRGRLDHVEPATAANLRQVLDLDAPPRQPAPAEPTGWRRLLDAVLHRTLWRTYARFRKLLGGDPRVEPVEQHLPADLSEQPGFKALTAAYEKADRLANRLAAVHRSEQVLLAGAMVVAAIVGSAWAIWPHVKAPAAAFELSLSIVALLVWAGASSGRQHELWSDQRYIAERLRLERAGWVLGLGSARLSPRREDAAQDVWREVRRSAGLPHGRFDAERVRGWGAWALGELVQGQAAYHRSNARRDNRLAHSIHLLEDATFLVFFVILSTYIAAYYGGLYKLLPPWFPGLVAMTGTVAPAVAAAAIALEAKLDFSEQSVRSQRISATLHALAARASGDLSFDGMQHVAREALRVHLAESNHWRDGAGRRRLFRL